MAEDAVAECIDQWRSMRQSTASTPKLTGTTDNGSLTIGPYIIWFDSQAHYRYRRFYWMICEAAKPEELLLWGYAPTQHQAELAATRLRSYSLLLALDAHEHNPSQGKVISITDPLVFSQYLEIT